MRKIVLYAPKSTSFCFLSTWFQWGWDCTEETCFVFWKMCTLLNRDCIICKNISNYLKSSTEMGQLLRHTCYLCFRHMLALDIKLCMELLRSREFELNGFINYAYMVDRMELPQHHEVSYMCRTGDVNVAEQVTCEHHSNNVQV